MCVFGFFGIYLMCVFGWGWQLVSPGTWLCDLTLERYEVREKKISKKV